MPDELKPAAPVDVETVLFVVKVREYEQHMPNMITKGGGSRTCYSYVAVFADVSEPRLESKAYRLDATYNVEEGVIPVKEISQIVEQNKSFVARWAHLFQRPPEASVDEVPATDEIPRTLLEQLAAEKRSRETREYLNSLSN